MLREMLRAKIHLATVTEANLNYVGSLTVPREILAAAGILAGEKIGVANVNNGARFETYVQAGRRRGVFCLNGAAARLGAPGDRIIVFAYSLATDEEARRLRPRIVLMGEGNRGYRLLGGARAARTTRGGRRARGGRPEREGRG